MVEIPLFLKQAAMPKGTGSLFHTHLASASHSASACCVITVHWRKYTPWKNQGLSSASHTHTHSHRAWWWCQFTFQVHRWCCYTIILALPWSGVHTVLRGLCRLAQAVTAFGLPWHVLTCSTNTWCSLSLLTVHWLQAYTVQQLHRFPAVIIACITTGVRCLLWKCSSFLDTHKELCLWWSRAECIAVSAVHAYCWGMFGDWVLPNSTDRVVWKIICAWLILFCIWTHSEAGASWWWLATQLLTLWSHAQSRNSCPHYVCITAPWIVSTEHLWVS